MAQIKLTVNEEKTRVCRVPQDTFDFLGYTFGRYYSPKTGHAYLGTRPSRKSIRRVIERLHAQTDVRTGLLDTTAFDRGETPAYSAEDVFAEARRLSR
jgi:hypothetical protein